ncbi:OmpA family protein [Rapidithrix thailandica]|uniref:OmpA family protein n=1 Tax=Rapidithrix thailandica TaxID=413964 RepID=A0AAW9SJQ9_9BACT
MFKLVNVALGICCLLAICTSKNLAQALQVNQSKFLKQARKYIEVQEYYHALQFLQPLVESDSGNTYYRYLTGIAYLNTHEKKKALPHLLLSQRASSPYPNLYFYLGRALHLHHQFDTAIHYYQKHLNTSPEAYRKAQPGDIHNSDFQRITEEEIQLLIRQCRTGKQLTASPLDLVIFNLGPTVNTEYPEVCPVISSDESRLIFTSRRPGNLGKALDPIQSLPYEDIYIAEKDENGHWQTPRNIGESINTTTHDASIGLSPDGQELFIYKDNNVSTLLSGDIYISKNRDESWTQPVKLQEGINTKNWETHASITADGKLMFFVSNREDPEAQGGRDIYMVRRLPDLSWAKPLNLGPLINTPFDEDAPYIHPNGKTLFFSSNGHNGMGGFDIYFTELHDLDNNIWTAPQNIGYPINSADDDIYYTVSADGSRGYFSSQREDSYGSFDLYMANIPSKQLNIIVLKGSVKDAHTDRPLGASIEIFDNTEHKLVKVAEANSFTGKFSLFLQPGRNYGIRVAHGGYLFKSINIDVPEQFEYLELHEDIHLKPIEENSFEVLNNIFFTDQMELKVESYRELQSLQQLLAEQKVDEIEIVVHSDNSQDSLVSKFTTQAMADVLVEELKLQNHTSTLIKAQGLGSNYPVALNTTQQGKRKNNRVEFIIRTDHASKEKAPLDYPEINPDLVLVELPKDSISTPGVELPFDFSFIQTVHKIKFAFADNSLNPEAILAIEEMVEMMEKMPGLIIEIGGHTDNIGSPSYNFKLAERRAKIVAQQMVFRGIARERLVIKSYGLSKPLASNKTDSGRQANRRIEFQVLKGGRPRVSAIEETNQPTTAPSYSLTTGSLIGQILYFDLNSDMLKAQKETLRELRNLLSQYPDLQIEIGGHTCDLGPESINQTLGFQRAKAVADFFISQGISQHNLVVTSYGETQPIAPNTSEYARKQNRRVEIRIYQSPQ